MNLLNRAEFLPAFVARLKEEPEAVIKEFEAFRDGGMFDFYCSDCIIESFLCIQ